jgi:hypothetical protein
MGGLCLYGVHKKQELEPSIVTEWPTYMYGFAHCQVKIQNDDTPPRPIKEAVGEAELQCPQRCQPAGRRMHL